MNNSRIFSTCQENLMGLVKRFGRSEAGLPAVGRSDFIDRLFGDLTHFSYVVELGAKSTYERKSS